MKPDEGPNDRVKANLLLARAVFKIEKTKELLESYEELIYNNHCRRGQLFDLVNLTKSVLVVTSLALLALVSLGSHFVSGQLGSSVLVRSYSEI